MSTAWLWKRTAWNCETFNGYSVTGHKDATHSEPYYFAYHANVLLDEFTTAAAAKARCVAHLGEVK